jgi:hypothetical protein
MHRRWRRPRWNIRGGGRSGRTEVVEVEAAKVEVAEMEGCIRGSGMHQRHWNASEALECVRATLLT